VRTRHRLHAPPDDHAGITEQHTEEMDQDRAGEESGGVHERSGNVRDLGSMSEPVKEPEEHDRCHRNPRS
jgi:hypothetical protein